MCQQRCLLGFIDPAEIDDPFARVAIRCRPLAGQHELQARHRMTPPELAEGVHQQADVLARILASQVEHVTLGVRNEIADTLRE